MRAIAIACVAIMTVTSEVAHAQQNRINSITTPPTAALTEFWTEQRLREATAMPVPVVDPSTFKPAGPAEPNSRGLRSGQSKAGPSASASAAVVAKWSGEVTQRPLYWAGKLFFSERPNTTSSCSAQFVAAGILLTAAHCVQNEKTAQWFSNFLYRHQFFKGRGSRDFSTECVSAYTLWVNGGDDGRWGWDYAMIKLRGGTDQGNFGWESGWRGKYNSVGKIGYPRDLERGQVIQVDFGRLIKGPRNDIVGLNHGNPRNAEGSSGGGWVARLDTTGNNPGSNRVISVTSHHLGDDKETSYGPYWDNRFRELINYTGRGCR